MYFGYRCCMKKNGIMHDIPPIPSDDEGMPISVGSTSILYARANGVFPIGHPGFGFYPFVEVVNGNKQEFLLSGYSRCVPLALVTFSSICFCILLHARTKLSTGPSI
ncbi:hypothetical protein CK203_046496 [Vitis vinifera]|uniref:Uncharacterized protein n=1 Tax=Vitis vinifera TaxID=29760 RepID=A0A438ILF4_VITVI|nr:hypothetical protein CK203_046496 [Vitis vinifera]